MSMTNEEWAEHEKFLAEWRALTIEQRTARMEAMTPEERLEHSRRYHRSRSGIVHPDHW